MISFYMGVEVHSRVARPMPLRRRARGQPLNLLVQVVVGITHVKISQHVASLHTSCQQVVFALLVASCQQVWNNL